MLPEHQAFSWLILCPSAMLTNCLAILTVTHYKRAYIGTDMIIILLLLTMAMNAGLLLTPAIFVMFKVQSWPHQFCLFYIWAFGFLRSMGLVGLFVLSFHWSYLSRMTPLHRVQTSSRPIICALVVVVLISVVVGLLPLVRMLMKEASGTESPEGSDSVVLLSSIFDERRQVCAFLSYDAEPVLAIFIIILTLMVFLAMIICLTDSGILLHSYKIMFIVKYKSGGFYDPEQARSLWSQSGLVSDTYSEINNTFDLWRVVLLQFFLCTMLNHIPYVCIEFVQLFSRQVQTEVLMLTVQWLQVMEFTLFPWTLCMGGRYRHAFAHLCRQIFCCDDSACEEENTCKLQSYRLKAHIKEQKQKAMESMEARKAQMKSKTPVLVKASPLSPLTGEPEGGSPQHRTTVTEVQADVHTQTTPMSRRGSTFQTGGAMARNTGPRISKGSPMVQRFAPTLKEEEASLANNNNTPLINLVRPTQKPVEVMGNTNNNNSAGAVESRSKSPSPVISESDSKATTMDLYDDDDIDAVLDNTTKMKGSPQEVKKSGGIEMQNIKVVDKASPIKGTSPIKGLTPIKGPSPFKGPSPKKAEEIQLPTFKKPAVLPKPMPKPEVKIWTSQSKSRPSNPSGISFDTQGGSGPYFEPVSESCSTTSEEVTQPKVLQAEHLSKSKTPYARSESFLQAVSSSSAYGTYPPNASSKFKLWTKIAQIFRALSVGSRQSRSARLSDGVSEQAAGVEVSCDKFARGEEHQKGDIPESYPRYTLKDRSALDPNSKQFHVTHDELASHEIIRKLRVCDGDETDEEVVEVSSTTDDTQPLAAERVPKSKKIPLELPKEFLGPSSVNPKAGITNMAAELNESPLMMKKVLKSPLNPSNGELSEEKKKKNNTKGWQSQGSGSSSSSDSNGGSPPAGTGVKLKKPEEEEEGSDGPGNKRGSGTGIDKDRAGAPRSPQVPRRIPPPKVVKKPVPPPPPPPPPPPSKVQQYLTVASGTSSSSVGPSESPRSVRSEASTVSSALGGGDQVRLLPGGSAGQHQQKQQKRTSLITDDLLASHDIIKRLQNQAEKRTEPLRRRPYTRMGGAAPTKPLLPPPPLPPTLAPPSNPIRINLAKMDPTTLTGSSDSGLGEQSSSGPEDEKSVFLSSVGRIYRSVSSESIFSHVESDTKEFPPYLSKGTIDLSAGNLLGPSSATSTQGSTNLLQDSRSYIFPPNLKDTTRCSRSASDISSAGPHVSYRPIVPPRSIPVQKVKSLQATMMEKEKGLFFGSQDVEDPNDESVATTETEEDSSEAPRSPKILKKIEDEFDPETSEKLRRELEDVEKLKRSPVFMRRFHQELVTRNLSDESTRPVFMSSTVLRKNPGATGQNNDPSASAFDDGSPAALRKFLAEVTAERRDPELENITNAPSSQIRPTREADPQSKSSDKGHVDIKAAL